MKAAYTAAEERLHDLIALLEESGHELAGEIRKAFDQLRGRVPVVEAEVKTDAGQVLHDAEAAAAPVVAEVEADAKQIAKDAAQAVIPPPRSPA